MISMAFINREEYGKKKKKKLLTKLLTLYELYGLQDPL